MLLLSLLLLPLLGASLLGAWPGLARQCAGRLAIMVASVSLILVAVLGCQTGVSWSLPWLPDAGIQLEFKVDGISWLFLLLTSIVSLFALAASVKLDIGGRSYFALILVMESMLFGVYTARHFIPWFLCWELTLIPAYLLVRLWGGKNAPRAARRFFIVTLAGGVCMLLGFLALQFTVETMDFDKLTTMASRGLLTPGLAHGFAGRVEGQTLLLIVAVAVFLGLAVKIPIVPLHLWLPDTYAEAPTPVTMLLTGVLSKMGVYGLLRVFLPIFPETFPVLAPWLTALAVATVLLGAVAALAQKDLKRILAYSSVNHLGYCALAAAAIASSQADRTAVSSAISGTILQAFNHGIIASALFFAVGILESRSGGSRGIHDFGGLRVRMPVFCGLMGIALFASLGLPGLSGFVGEFLIFNGVFGLLPWAAVVSVIGLLLTAVFLLRALRTVFTGPLPERFSKWTDLSTGERWLFVPLVVLIVVPGLWPQILLQFANHETVRLLEILRPIP